MKEDNIRLEAAVKARDALTKRRVEAYLSHRNQVNFPRPATFRGGHRNQINFPRLATFPGGAPQPGSRARPHAGISERDVSFLKVFRGTDLTLLRRRGVGFWRVFLSKVWCTSLELTLGKYNTQSRSLPLAPQLGVLSLKFEWKKVSNFGT